MSFTLSLGEVEEEEEDEISFSLEETTKRKRVEEEDEISFSLDEIPKKSKRNDFDELTWDSEEGEDEEGEDEIKSEEYNVNSKIHLKVYTTKSGLELSAHVSYDYMLESLKTKIETKNWDCCSAKEAELVGTLYNRIGGLVRKAREDLKAKIKNTKKYS